MGITIRHYLWLCRERCENTTVGWVSYHAFTLFWSLRCGQLHLRFEQRFLATNTAMLWRCWPQLLVYSLCTVIAGIVPVDKASDTGTIIITALRFLGIFLPLIAVSAAAIMGASLFMRRRVTMDRSNLEACHRRCGSACVFIRALGSVSVGYWLLLSGCYHCGNGFSDVPARWKVWALRLSQVGLTAKSAMCFVEVTITKVKRIKQWRL